MTLKGAPADIEIAVLKVAYFLGFALRCTGRRKKEENRRTVPEDGQDGASGGSAIDASRDKMAFISCCSQLPASSSIFDRCT